jgi:hypothetical protein
MCNALKINDAKIASRKNLIIEYKVLGLILCDIVLTALLSRIPYQVLWR